MTLTGSIGVIFLKPYSKGLLEKIGITVDTLNRGKYSDEFVFHKGLSQDGKELFTEMIMETYDQFTTKAAAGRHLELDSLLKIAQGRIWIGSTASEIGLVDRIAGLSEAIDIAARMAKIPEGEMGIKIYPAEKNFFEMAFETSRAPSLRTVFPERVANEIEPYFTALEYFAPNEPLTLLPFIFKLDN
jgi:protease-4